MASEAPLRIGLIGQPKKFAQFFDAFMLHCTTSTEAVEASRRYGFSEVQCIPFEFSRDCGDGGGVDDCWMVRPRAEGAQGDSAADDGEIHVLFHKISDELAVAAEDAASRSKVAAVHHFISASRAVLFEDLRVVSLLTDRVATLQAVQAALAAADLSVLSGVALCVPQTFFRTDNTDGCENALGCVGAPCLAPDNAVAAEQLVFVCKTRVACGAAATHHMQLHAVASPSSAGGAAVAELLGEGPGMVAQQFVSAALPFVVKVYVVGHRPPAVRVVAVQQLCDAARGLCSNSDRPFSFDSQDKSLFAAAPEAAVASLPSDLLERAAAVAAFLQQRVLSGMSLFGFDLLLEPAGAAGGGRRCFLIDVNYFPGYKGVSGVHQWILEELLTRCFAQQ